MNLIDRSKIAIQTVGLVGCGRVSRYHVDAIRALSDQLRVVGACDTDLTARDRIASLLECQPVTTLSDLLNQTPDLVVIATPSGTHAEQAIQAMRAGSDVLTEKPMATRWSDVQEMNRVAKETGQSLFVVKQQRYLPSIRSLVDAVRSGKLGRIYSANINVIWRRPQAYYDLADWRGTFAEDGGALMNQAIHYVDILQWLVGPVESVQAFAATLARTIEVEDTITASLKFRSGALGSISATTLAHPDNFGCSLTLVGEHGIVRLGGMACDQIEHWGIEGETPRTIPSDDYVYESGHLQVYRDVLTAMRGEPSDAVDGVEGAKSLEIVIAAYRAASEGQKVTLPLT